MGLAVTALVGAIVVAFAFGGSWSGLGEIRLRRRRLVVAAVLAQVGGALTGVLGVADERGAYVVGLAVSALFAAAFCASNLRVAGLPLVALGLGANALVVGVNGAMPVSIVAAARAGVPIVSISAGTDPRHDISGIGTTWRTLGDVVPVPLPLRPEVVSPGDVLVAAGLAELVAVGMLRRRRARGVTGRAGAVMRWSPASRRRTDGEEVA